MAAARRYVSPTTLAGLPTMRVTPSRRCASTGARRGSEPYDPRPPDLDNNGIGSSSLNSAVTGMQFVFAVTPGRAEVLAKITMCTGHASCRWCTAPGRPRAFRGRCSLTSLATPTAWPTPTAVHAPFPAACPPAPIPRDPPLRLTGLRRAAREPAADYPPRASHVPGEQRKREAVNGSRPANGLG